MPISLPSSQILIFSDVDNSSPASKSDGEQFCGCCKMGMSPVEYNKHAFCQVCRDVECCLEVRCPECINWSDDFMNAYLKHHEE